MATVIRPEAPANDSQGVNANELVRQLISHEIVFGVVGPVGSGTSEVAEALHGFLRDNGYDAAVFKARDAIVEWAAEVGHEIRGDAKMEQTQALQDAGDELRRTSGTNAAVAVRLMAKIRDHRASATQTQARVGEAVTPDDQPRAYILDSLRNPGEVDLLRRVYQQAFCLIGVVCDEETREQRLTEKYQDAGKRLIQEFMARDEKAAVKHGQQVSSTFHLSDFFVDNSAPRMLSVPGGGERPNPEWNVTDELGRLTDILSHREIVRPRPNETAMYHAYGARMRSACLSRQVGAALLDAKGNLLATGTNEVPKGGGGVYGGGFENFTDIDPHPETDHRCAYHGGFCRNIREQNDIINELITALGGE